MKKTSGLSELILTTCNVAKVTCDESDKEAEMKRLRQEIDQILKEDDRLKTCLLDLVQHQWPFSWIKGQQTFLDLINREIGQTISQEFKKAENKPCPTVRLTFGKKIHLSQGKIKKGSKWDFKATMGGIDKKVYSELSAIPFENPTTDVLQVIIDKDGTCFAVAFVPLRDVIQGQFQNWTAKDLEDRPVGHLEMQVDFNNVDHVSHKEMAQKILNENMLKLVSELYEQPFDEGKKVTKVQYGVLISEEKTKPGEAWLTRTSVTLFSDDVSVATEFLPDNGTQVFLPIQDLTSEKVEIRVHQRKTSPSSKKAEFLNKLKSLKNNNNYENVGYNYDWTQIRLSEICFKEGLKFKWRDDLIWHLRLAVKCPQSFQKMSLDELTAFQTLTELKREWVDSTPLLNYSRPFFSPLEWKTAELNAKLRLFNLKASQRQSFEEQILDRLLDLTKKHHEVPQLEVESLNTFKMSCLEVICSFDGNVNSIPRLNKIVVALNSLFEEEELRREMDRVMHQKIGEKITLAYEESLPKKVMILQSILSKFVTPTLEIALQKFSRFGLLIWCPVLSKNSFKLLLPFARILIHETLNLESIDEKIFEKMFSIYRDFAELLKFGSDLHKNEFADTFDACLSIWAKVAAEKAKKQINVVLEQKKGANKGEEKKKKQTTLGQIWTMEDVVSEAWSDGAMNVCGILISCHKSWEMLKYPCPERHMSFGTQLLALILNDVFPHYIKGFKSIIMDDSLFDHIEFVLAVNALCKSSKYLELFEATAESLQNQGKNGVCASTFKDLVDTAKDNVNEIVMDLITVFGKCQESKFNVFIKEKRFCHDNELLPEEHIYSGLQSYYSTEESQDPSHLLGYVNCLLKFIYENLDSEVEEKYNGLVKEKLFDILEDCFMSVDLKKHKRFLPQLIYAIEHSIEFRTTVKLGESQKLSRVKDNLWMQNADLCQLISKFYGELDLTSEENRGVFKAQISQTGNAIDFTLLSVANLVPRRDKKTLDFSLEVAVFPIPQSYKTNQSTKIYCQSDVRIFNLQDVDSLQKKDDTYYGKLLIPAAALKENLFLKILVYDHSVTRTNKVFRGIYLAPLESVSNQILAGDFYAFPEITPTHPNWDIFQEIKSRESSVASHAIKDIKCYMSEKRKISLTK